MILVGQYDSPYVRRVAVSLCVLGFAFEHDTRSVFADFDAMRGINPLGRIPSLILDDCETLIDSAAILDWLDQSVGPEHALVPAAGPERRRALRRIVLATGVIDKAGAAAYERIIRPSALRWPEWAERCRIQATGAIQALATEAWPIADRLDQAQITTACDDSLPTAGRSRSHPLRPLSGTRRTICALRGATRIPRHLSGRIRRAAKRVTRSARTVLSAFEPSGNFLAGDEGQ